MYRTVTKTAGCSLLAILAACPLAAHAQSRTAELLGIPIKSVVFGNRGDQMFVFDPALLQMVKTFASPIGRMDYMTVAPNGKLYGINGSAIGEIDPTTWSAQKIAQEGGRFLAADGDSHLYFARGAQLYRLK